MMDEGSIFNAFTIPALFLFCLFLYKRLTQPVSSKLPPSPPGFPVIGNLHQLTSCPHRGLFALSRQYGDTMLIHLGAKPVLVVSSATSACHVLKTHDVAFASRPQSGMFHHLLYDGRDVAAAPYGEYWRQIKSVCVLQLLSSSRVRSYNQVRKEEVCSMMEKVRSLLGKEVNMNEVFMELMKDVICRVTIGKKCREKSELTRLLNEFEVLAGGFYVGDFIPWLRWTSRVSGLHARVERLRGELDGFLEGVVKEHEDQTVIKRDHKDECTKDFVDVLMDVQRDEAMGFPLERDSIKAIILDTFAAGTDTSYAVLEWTMYELMRNPKSMKTLQDEIRRTIGSSSAIIDDDLDKMKYLKATIKEAMRLHPPVPLLPPRESVQDVDFDGYSIPVGTQVITNAWAIQRDPTQWSNPNEFQPERFLDSKVDYKGQDFGLIPFGAGRRGCPGISFAIATIELALASLLWKFDWSLPRGVNPESLNIKEISALTIHMENPLIIVPTLSN
ncbi:hypothetical protein V2J09_011921 [Rumex salicifolius]